jgi:hypothetical protein
MNMASRFDLGSLQLSDHNGAKQWMALERF